MLHDRLGSGHTLDTMRTLVADLDGASSSLSSRTMAKETSSGMEVKEPSIASVKRRTSKVHLPDLRFDHVQLDEERPEVLDERCWGDSILHTGAKISKTSTER